MCITMNGFNCIADIISGVKMQKIRNDLFVVYHIL